MSDDDGNFVLRWDLHEEIRTSTLKSLWKNEDFLDVTIACDDDQIDAHKVILSAASTFFHRILKRNPHSHPLIYLKGTTKKDLQSLLNFIYSGESQVLQEELEGFMALASNLEVKGLVDESLTKDENSAKSFRKIMEKKTESRINAQRNEPGTKKEKYAESGTKLEKKKPKFRNKQKFREEDVLLVDDIQIVELAEEITVNESDIVDRYESAEDNDSFQSQNTSNTSLTEYDDRVSELVTKTENSWTCTECPYSSRNRNHVQEHVEAHIEGYSHECKFCDKTFGKKRSLRQHKNKCTNAFNV